MQKLDKESPHVVLRKCQIIYRNNREKIFICFNQLLSTIDVYWFLSSIVSIIDFYQFLSSIDINRFLLTFFDYKLISFFIVIDVDRLLSISI